MTDYTVRPIATARSPYPQKFGIPRQPQLVAAACRIELDAQFGFDSVRGLEAFGYIWVQFLFHDTVAEGWAQMVRPPRLGGKKKMGVFATRSPHRPNHLGLSLLKLERIEQQHGRVILHCSGADLLDGTPVLDIKPYLPFVEARPDAASGFVSGAPETLSVSWLPESGMDAQPETVRRLIADSIAQDPRPAYQNLPERIYTMTAAGCEVRFRIDGRQATVLSCRAAES